MLIALALACTEPEHIDPPSDRGQPDESTPPESAVDSVPAGPGEWVDPIDDVGDMDVVNSGMEITDAVRAGDLLYLTGQQQQGSGGVWIVDVSDPEAPTQVAQGNVRTVQYVCHDGTDAWGVDRLSFLFHITYDGENLSIPGTNTQVGGDIDCDADHVAWGAAAFGARLAVNEGDGALGEALEIEGNWIGVQLANDSLYTAGPNAIARYDLDGTELASVEIEGWCRDIELLDEVLAVACGADGVHLLDPSDLSLLGTWSGHVSARTLSWDEDHLWVAAWSDLVLLDVSDPTAPFFIGSQPARSSVMAVVSAEDGLAHVGDWRTPFAVRRTDGSAPEIRLSPANAIPGDRIAIVNDGTEPLWVEVDAGTLSTSLIEPGERATLDIPEDFSGDAIGVRSDDPDEPESEIEIGSMNGQALGEPAPEFTEYDLEGTLWDLQSLRGEVIWLATFNDG